MSADAQAPKPELTIEDVRHRAEQVRDLATTQAKQTANDVMAQPITRIAIVGAVALAVGLSIAFYMGKRSVPRPRY